jgi:hypothetical protein
VKTNNPGASQMLVPAIARRSMGASPMPLERRSSVNSFHLSLCIVATSRYDSSNICAAYVLPPATLLPPHVFGIARPVSGVVDSSRFSLSNLNLPSWKFHRTMIAVARKFCLAK